MEKNADLLRFCRALIHFRRQQPTVRRTDFLRGEPDLPGSLPDVSWFGPEGEPMTWNGEGPSTDLLVRRPAEADVERTKRHVLLMFNAGPEGREFTLPRLPGAIRWRLFLDTQRESPDDIFPELDGPAPPASGKFWLEHHALACFVSSDAST